MDQRNRKKSYDKGISASNAGTEYQIKLLAIFLLRGVLQHLKFDLATEMKQEDVGKFDDVIFSWFCGNSLKESLLLQAKHSLYNTNKIALRTLTSTKDNDFSLVKYFHSYLDRIKFNKDLGNIKGLVVFTNKDIDRTVMEHVEIVSSLNTILKDTFSGSFYKFTPAFMEKLRDNVIIYQCDLFAKELSNNLLNKRDISLQQNNNSLVKLQLSLLCYCFELTATNNMHRICKLRQEFINDSETKNKFCVIFKNALEDELKKKSTLFCEQMKKGNVDSLDDNILFSFNHLDSYLNQYEIHVEGDLNVNCECLSEEIISMKDVTEFSELFIMAVNQPNVNKLDECIKDLLIQHPLFESFNVGSAAKHLLSRVDEWFNEKTGLFMSDVTGNNILINIYLELTSSLCIGKNNSLGIVYWEHCLKEFSEGIIQPNQSKKGILELLKSQQLIHINSKCDIKFTIAKLHQALLNKGNYFYLESTLVIDKLLKGINLIDSIISMDKLTGVIFYCTDCNLSLYSSFFQSMKRMIGHCKVILITPNNSDDCMKDILNKTFDPLEVQHIDCEISFTEISTDSLNVILSRKNVEFQGTVCSLLDIFNENDINKFIDMNGLSELTTDNVCLIGDMSNSLSDLPAAYSKSFHKVSLDRLLRLISCDEYVFVVSICKNSTILKNTILDLHKNESKCSSNNFNKEIYMQISQNLITFDHNINDRLWNQNQFHKVCKKFLNKVVFWIEAMKDALILHQVYNPDCYIKRQLNCVESVEIQMREISELLSKGNTDSRFVIGHATNDQVQQLMNCGKIELEEWIRDKKILITQENNVGDLFDKGSELFGDIHFMELKDGKMLWVKSHGSLDFIRKCKISKVAYGEEHFVSKQNSMIIISDDAGMGKSTTLTSLTHNMIVNELKRWVVRINFKERCVQDGLKVLSKKQVTVENVACFICAIDYLNLKNSLANLLLRYYLELDVCLNNRLVLVLDGLDEVPPVTQEIVNKLLKFLRQHTTCTIFLATRRHFTPPLEDHFSIFAVYLDEISFEDQCLFLVNYWYNQLILISDEFSKENLLALARKYLIKMKDVLKDNLRFLGIPLHLRLISEVSLSYIIKREFESFLFKNNDLNVLYEEFINTKFDIYFNEKSGNVLPFSFQIEILRKNFHKTHSKIAFLYLFSEYCSRFNVKVNVEINNFASDFMLIGLLHSKSMNGERSFIHRTFCEYFCASFLLDCLHNRSQNESYYQMVRNVVKDELFRAPKRDPFKMLKIFLDSRLVNDLPLHKSVFQNDPMFTLLVKESDRAKRDILDRTALHIAAQYADSPVVTFLLNSGYNATEVDLFGRNPLHYASQRGHIDNVKCLIAPYIDINIHSNIFIKPLNKRRRPETVFDDVVFGQSALCEMINLKDECGQTCLYYANKSEELNLCSLLIAHGSIVSFRDKNLEHVFLLELLLARFFKDGVLPAIALLISRSSVSQLSTLEHLLPLLVHKLINYGYAHVVAHLLYLGVLSKLTSANYHPSRSLVSFVSIARYLSHEDHMEIIASLPKHEIYFKFSNYPQGSNKCLEYCLYYTAVWGYLKSFKQLIKFSQEIQVHESSTFFQRLINIFSSEEERTCSYANMNLSKYLYEAMIKKHRNIVEFIGKYYQNIAIDRTYGNSPLMLAAFSGDLDFVKFFCENGADVNYLDYFMSTPLHLAAEQRNLEVIKYLVKAGGNVNAVDSECKTVLDCALTSLEYPKESHCDEEIFCIEYLVLNSNARMFSDKNDSNKKEIKRILKATHETVNIQVDGTTLLHKALQIGNEILIRRLLDLGAKVNSKDTNGRTPLEYLKQPSYLSRILFEYGAQFDLQTHHHLSIDHNGSQIVSHGVPKLLDLFTSDTLGEDLDILSQKIKMDDVDTFVIIRNATNSNGSLVHRAAFKNDVKALSILIEHNEYTSIDGYTQCWPLINLSLQNDYGDSPMHIAAHSGSVDIVKILIKNGAKYNSVDNYGKTPAGCCDNQTDNGRQIIETLNIVKEFFKNVMQNSLSRVEKMLIECEYINVRDEFGRTALHWAVFHCHFKMVLLLIENGADIESTDDSKQTPLHFAAKNGNLEIMYHLLSHGCVFNCKDLNGERPSDLYVKEGNILKEIEQMFYLVLIDENDKALTAIRATETNTKLVTALVNTCDVQGNTLLHYAFDKGNLKLVLFVFWHGGMYNKGNKKGNTPLKVYHCDLNCYFMFYYVNGLFGNYPGFKYHDENIVLVADVADRNGDRLLHCTDDVYLVKQLIKHSKRGIDVRDAEGRTPLMRAIMRNNLTVVKVMLKNDADLKIQAKNGDTALHMAVRGGDLLMIAYLVEMEGMKDMTIQNRLGHTPIHIARSLDNQQILNFLLNFMTSN